MTATAVIYIFRCPKGRVYVGRRSVSQEALRAWPGHGVNRLPDGYAGSGKAWQAIHRRHGPMCVWRIVARVEGDRGAVNKAERRAVRLARALFGQRCVNIREGGDGMTSADAQALASDPKRLAGLRARHADPEYVIKNRAALARLNTEPEIDEKRRAGLALPEVKARRKATHKALAQTPERAAQLAAAIAYRWSPKGRAKSLERRLQAPVSAG